MLRILLNIPLKVLNIQVTSIFSNEIRHVTNFRMVIKIRYKIRKVAEIVILLKQRLSVNKRFQMCCSIKNKRKFV